MTIQEKDIRKKIEEVEEELKKIKITLVTTEAYRELIGIHKELWELLYFKLNQEENYLLK